jgi:hypothetical protein
MLYIICVFIQQESSKAYFLAKEDQAVPFVTVYDLAEFEDGISQAVASVAEVQLHASFSERQGKRLRVYFASLNCYIICCGSRTVHIILYLEIRCLTAANARLGYSG